MTGLEKIIEQIKLDTDKACEQIAVNAQAECEKIKADGERKASQRYAQLIDAAEKECRLENEKARSGAQSFINRAVLTAKTEIINEVISETLEKLRCLETEGYFEAVKALIVKYATGEAGDLMMNTADIVRMPKGFMKEFSSLTLREAAIPDGFILRYGGIEQNCTFEALIESEKENIKDMLYKQMFE